MRSSASLDANDKSQQNSKKNSISRECSMTLEDFRGCAEASSSHSGFWGTSIGREGDNAMFRKYIGLWVVAGLLSIGSTSFAQGFMFATLTNAGEPPSGTNPTLVGGQPRPASFGSATFLIAADQSSITMD